MEIEPTAHDPAAYLFVLNDIEGLKWVLASSRAGFTRRWREVLALRPGDQLFLYCGRRIFEEGAKIIGEARVESPVEPPPAPIRVGALSLTLVCGVRPLWLARPGTGIPYMRIAAELRSSGSLRPYALRRPLVELLAEDVELIRGIGLENAVAPEVVLDGYRDLSSFLLT
jgi:hypothetical protein